jgi:hypothetical protein
MQTENKHLVNKVYQTRRDYLIGGIYLFRKVERTEVLYYKRNSFLIFGNV